MAYTTRADSNSVGPGSMGGGSSTSSGGGLSGGGMGGGGSNSSSNSSFQGGTTAAHNLSLNGVNQASNNGLGLTVGKYMPGNAAYGPAGGRAVGYATVSPGSSNSGVKNNTGSSSYANPGAGNGIGQNTYTTFRNPDGTPMFGNGPGAPGGSGVNASSGLKAQQIAQKMSSPYIKPTGMSGYKKPSPPAALAKRTISKQKPLTKPPAKAKLPSIPPNAFMYPFQGANFQNRRIGEVYGNQAVKQITDRVPTRDGELRWNSTGIGGYPGTNINKDQSRVPQMAKGGSVPGKPKPKPKGK